MDRSPLMLDQLLLDTENPRFGSARGQREAIQALLDDQKEKLTLLASSIVSDGLNPLDRLLVMRDESDPTQYIVLEGNRRLVVNKLLANPALLASLQMPDAQRKKFLVLAKQYNRKNIEPIDCAIAKDRDEAKQWLFLRHTGQNEGKGIVDWSGIQRARFRGTDPALQAIEFVKTYGKLTIEEREAIETKPFITTLDRLLSSVPVRQRLGLDIQNRQLVTTLSHEELIKPLRKIILDLATDAMNVTKLKHKSQQIDYIDNLATEHRPDLTKKGDARPVDPGPSTDEAKKQRVASAVKRTVADPSKRLRLIPTGTKLNITDPRPAEIYGEIKRLRVDKNPNAVAVLLRVFLEMSIEHYMAKEGLPTKKNDNSEKTLNAKILDVIAYLESKGCSKKDFVGVRRAMSDTASPLHTETLNAYVHNRYTTPKPRDLTSTWDDARPLFGSIWS